MDHLINNPLVSTSLFVAVKVRNLPAIAYLLKEPKFTHLNYINQGQTTALCEAVESGYLEGVEILCSHPKIMLSQGKPSYSALYWTDVRMRPDLTKIVWQAHIRTNQLNKEFMHEILEVAKQSYINALRFHYHPTNVSHVKENFYYLRDEMQKQKELQDIHCDETTLESLLMDAEDTALPIKIFNKP